MHLRSSLLWGSLSLTCLLPGLTQGKVLTRASPITTVGLVPGTTGLENLAVRSNGDVLVTSTSSNILHLICPTDPASTAINITTFPNLTALFGIVELEPDVFYVAGSIYTGEIASANGTNEIWRVDMRPFVADTTPADVSLLTGIPSAQLLNSVTPLAANDTTHFLASDSPAGTIILVDVQSGTSETVLSDPSLTALDPDSGALGIGINGIKMFEDILYFVNLDLQLLGSVPFDLGTGQPKGDVVIISDSIPTAGDDLVISKDGSLAWIAINGGFQVFEVDLTSGVGRNISDPLLRSITALAYPRVPTDGAEKGDLYITGAVEVGNSTEGALFLADATFFA